MWTKEDEDVLVERNEKSLRALALLDGDRLSENTVRTIAFGQALATLHLREANAAALRAKAAKL